MKRIVDMATWLRGLFVMENRKKAYQLSFGSPAGAIVLKDLVPFCRLYKTSWHEDQRISERLEGRREVILRIMDHMNLSEQQLMELYSGMERPLEDRING